MPHTIETLLLCREVVYHVLPRQVSSNSIDLRIHRRFSADVALEREGDDIPYLQVGNIHIVQGNINCLPSRPESALDKEICIWSGVYLQLYSDWLLSLSNSHHNSILITLKPLNIK